MNYIELVSAAVRTFWAEREQQRIRQAASPGDQDRGSRGAVTGGKQLDGFVAIIGQILRDAGLASGEIYTKHDTTLPGFFRPAKNWDIVAVAGGELIATIELKSHVGPSFGNNFNNRVEEAIGSSTDILTAYREGKFQLANRPWLGWLMLLEDADESNSEVRVNEPHFPVFPEFKNGSYAKRYEVFCEKLMRERLYDATCLILSGKGTGVFGQYREPNPDLGFAAFAASLKARALAYSEHRRSSSP